MTPTHTSTPGLAHLKGRDRHLARFDWTPKQAEWVALACLHSGCFLRSQLTTYLQCSPSTASDFIRSLIDNEHAVELSLPLPGSPRLCRLSNKAIYRHLGAANIRHRRPASPRLTYGRILALDYILENTHQFWLPTEADKVAFFHNVLSIPKDYLPSRVYQGNAGGRRRYFVAKFPISISSKTVTMVYIDTGYPSDRPLRKWIVEHQQFLSLVAEAGYQPHIVFVTNNPLILPAADNLLKTYTTKGTALPTSALAIQKELESIKTAVVTADATALNSWGGIHKAMARRFELEAHYTELEQQSTMPLFRSYSLWKSDRLNHIEFTHLDRYEFEIAGPLLA